MKWVAPFSSAQSFMAAATRVGQRRVDGLALLERALKLLEDVLGKALALDGQREDVGAERVVGGLREIGGAERAAVGAPLGSGDVLLTDGCHVARRASYGRARGHARSTGLIAGDSKASRRPDEGHYPHVQDSAAAFLPRVGRAAARRVRAHAEPRAPQARALLADRADPRSALGVRAGVDGHLPARAPRAEPGHRRVGLGGAAHAHGLPVRPGGGPVARGPGQRRPRAPAAAAGRPGRVHRRLAPVRRGPRRVVADRRPRCSRASPERWGS